MKAAKWWTKDIANFYGAPGLRNPIHRINASAIAVRFLSKHVSGRRPAKNKLDELVLRRLVTHGCQSFAASDD